MSQQIKNQFLSRLPASAPESYRQAIETAFQMSEAFKPKAEAIRNDGRYSAEGRKQATKDAMAGMLDQMKQLRAGVARDKAALQSRRANLVPNAPDRADLFGEMQRREVRDWLRSLPESQRMQVALNDPEVREAITNAPAALSGLSSEIYNRVQEAALEAAHGPALKSLAAEDDAVAEVDAALQIAAMQLETVSGVELPELKGAA